MRIWIDLANSPQSLLFSPISRRLEERGHDVRVTVRDHAQTVELARERWPDAELIGGGSPASRGQKARTLLSRVAELRRWARGHRPDLALSHNSYAQIVAARLAGVPAITAMDFEHQPANHLAFRLARTVLVPDVFPAANARRQGAADRKLVRYPGLKEALYLGDFEPDPDVLEKVGVGGIPASALAVARTPPSRAVYHGTDNPLFDACLQALDDAGTVTVILPRHPEQVEAIGRLGLERAVVPGAAIDSRSLMRFAGLFLGAGGTMTREAALLGVQTVTVFAGKVPAVDRRLEDVGLIARVGRGEELPSPAERPIRQPDELRQEAAPILDRFVEAVEAAANE